VVAIRADVRGERAPPRGRAQVSGDKISAAKTKSLAPINKQEINTRPRSEAAAQCCCGPGTASLE